MAEPNQFQYPAYYSPGQIAFNNNAEMSRLLSLFGGPVLQSVVGAGNFLPHMTPSQGLMDQYMARQYQNQTRMSEFYMAGAGNQDVANRLLALRTMGTDAPASELNKQQAEQFAGLLNNPMTKSIVGGMIGPENLEALLHGQKGDVAALNQVANRIGFFRNDPSGGKRMDARSLEDFSRGMYAHMYEEGGNLSGVERDVRMVGGTTQEYNNEDSVKTLKKYAKMEDRTLLSDDEVTDRVSKRLAAKELSADDVSATYKKYVAGDETDTTKQVEALTKFDAAIKSLDATVKGKSADKTGILQKDDVTVDSAIKAAKNNRLGEMNGFMAGQVGQVAEQMFQRGMLPQAFGSLSAAKRVELLADASNKDPETQKRLAEEFGHRDLMTTDTKYATDTPEEQRKTLAARLPEYKSKIAAVQAAAESGVSAQEIEKMESYDAVAGNVDAKRSAAAIKKYTGSLAAVREIFGDNGNPNAPMPALMAALDHLSQGAAGQMDPKKIEASLRSMQHLAKESGIGFEQMAGMASQMGAMGDMMGISKSQTMHNQVNAMAMIKTMRDTGAFANPVFGAMSQAEATQVVAEKLQAGAASDNGRMLAAAAGLYKIGKDQYAEDSEFAKAMAAYNDPGSGGDYTIEENGKLVTKNVYDMTGKEGPAFIQRLFRAVGGSEAQLSAAFMNPASQQFADAFGGMKTQKAEILRDINNLAVSGTLQGRLRENAKPGTELAKRDQAATADITGMAVSELILESSRMPQEEQVAYIQKTMETTLEAAFKKDGATDAEAKVLAAQAATAYMGSDKSKQANQVKQLIDQTGAMIYNATGMTMPAIYTVYGENRVFKSAKEAEQAKAVAQRKAEMGLNFSSQPLARVSDYLLEMGQKGGKVTWEGISAALTNMIPDKELREKYAKGMAPGLEYTQREIDKLSVTREHIDSLKNTGNNTALKKLAGVDDKTTVVSDDDVKARQLEEATKVLTDNEKVTETYKRVIGQGRDTTLSVDEQRKQLLARADVREELAGNVIKDGEIAQAKLHERADLRIGTALDNLTVAEQQRRENFVNFRHGQLEGGNENSVSTAVYSALKAMDIDPTAKAAGADPKSGKTHTEELTALIGKFSADPEQDKEHQNALAAYAKKIGLSDEQLSGFEAARQGVRRDIGSVLGNIDQAAGAAQNVAQQIETASIRATTVTVTKDTDAAANAPAGDSIKPAADGTVPAGANATGAASSTAADTAASAQTVEPVTPAALPSGAGKESLTVVQGSLKITNFQEGVLELLARNNNPIHDTPAGGAGIHVASGTHVA